MVSIFIALLFLLPALFIWRKEIRLRKLANSRYQLSRSVTEMERLMLSGDIKLGDVSHDILFMHMQRVQNSNVYEVNWNVLKSPNKKVAELEKRLRAELSEDGCQFSNITKEFAEFYFKAFRHKHPFKSLVYVLHLQLLHGGLKCLFISLLCMVSVLRSIETIKSRQKRIFEEISLNFFSHSEAVWIKGR